MTHWRANASAWLLMVLLWIPGCATQLDQPDVSDEEVSLEQREQLRLALAMRLDRQAQVWKLGSRLRAAGAELCGKDVRYTFGFFSVDRQTFAQEYRDVASDLGLGDGVYIWDLREDISRFAAAFGRGDRIAAIDGAPISDFRSFEKAMAGPFEAGRLSLELAKAGTGERTRVSLQGIRVCDYRVAMLEADSVNAFADGKNVFITTGMFRFTESDDDMSIVVGHELAHNVLGHVKQQRAQVLGGMLLDVALAVFTGVYTSTFQELAALSFSQEM